MAESSLFQLTDRAIRAELNVAAYAEFSQDWPHKASERLLQLSKADARFKHWPASFERSHRILHATVGYYAGAYWRVNVEMPLLRVNPSVSNRERTMVTRLAETVLFTRVPEKPTGNTVHPYAPTREDLRAEWIQVHQELGSGDEALYKLSHATWRSVITSLIDGQVRIGQIGQ